MTLCKWIIHLVVSPFTDLYNCISRPLFRLVQRSISSPVHGMCAHQSTIWWCWLFIFLLFFHCGSKTRCFIRNGSFILNESLTTFIRLQIFFFVKSSNFSIFESFELRNIYYLVNFFRLFSFSICSIRSQCDAAQIQMTCIKPSNSTTTKIKSPFCWMYIFYSIRLHSISSNSNEESEKKSNRVAWTLRNKGNNNKRNNNSISHISILRLCD